MSFLPRSTKNSKDKLSNEKMKTPTARESKHKPTISNKFDASKKIKLIVIIIHLINTIQKQEEKHVDLRAV